MEFPIRIKHKKDGKFVLVECIDYPVFTQGRSIEEAKANLKDALILYAMDSEVQSEHPELRKLVQALAEANKPANFTVPMPEPHLPPVPNYGAFTFTVGARALSATL